jgi:WhiB family transcriptional regulator, redox-sensing transcriptional regulator
MALRAVDEPQDWRDFALCREFDPDLWFVEKGGDARPAKRICGKCPSRPDCLEYALETDQRFGIYGGKSDGERRKLKRQRQEQAA